MYVPSTKWTWSFTIIVFIQACAVLALEAYAFAIFEIDVPDVPGAPPLSLVSVKRAIPTFLALYIFGFFYQMFLVYDALRAKNTIQVIGLVALNVGLLIYGGVQFNTIQKGINLASTDLVNNEKVLDKVQPFLIAIPCILAVGTVLMAFVAWKLYDEFAWTIYKHISADLRMKKRYLTYQIYIALLKFDFFFFLGFTIQFVVVVRGRTNTEFGLTIAAIPVTIVILFAAAFFTIREILSGMILVIVLYFGGLAYFIFKLVRMYSENFKQPYLPARTELTTFAAITIVLILMTIVNASMCAANFDKGLRPYITSKKIDSDEEKLGTSAGSRPPVYSNNSGVSGYGYTYEGQNVEMVQDPYGKPGRVAPTRMEID